MHFIFLFTKTQHLDQLMNLPLDSVKMEPCYVKVNLLQERLQDLKSRFRFPHVDLVVQRTQNDMQEVGAAGASRWVRTERAEKQVLAHEAGVHATQGSGTCFLSCHTEPRTGFVLPAGFVLLP